MRVDRVPVALVSPRPQVLNGPFQPFGGRVGEAEPGLCVDALPATAPYQQFVAHGASSGDPALNRAPSPPTGYVAKPDLVRSGCPSVDVALDADASPIGRLRSHGVPPNGD